MGIAWNILQSLKKRLQLYMDSKRKVEAEMNAEINRRIVQSSIQQVEEVCEEKGLLLAIAVYPDADGKPTCTYSLAGLLSIPNLEMVEAVADKINLSEVIQRMNNILHPPLKPVLPSNKEEYEQMVASMVKQAQEGMLPDNTQQLLNHMLEHGDIKSIDCALDQYNNIRNGRQPLGC